MKDLNLHINVVYLSINILCHTSAMLSMTHIGMRQAELPALSVVEGSRSLNFLSKRHCIINYHFFSC